MNRPHFTPSYLQLFWVFLKLGCTSFGGPAAHLVFFHNIFVKKLAWIDPQHYAQLVALGQILPGPTSSQVGIAIGYSLKGYSGAIISWLGFTLPSAILMCSAAFLGLEYQTYLTTHVFHVVQLIVLAIVIWAFWQMLQSFCHTIAQYILMLFTTLFVYFSTFLANQISALIFCALVSYFFLKTKTLTNNPKDQQLHTQKKKNFNYLWLILFILPILVLPTLNSQNLFIQSFQNFYSNASFVFGGGHIILPLLHQSFVESQLIDSTNFDLGYALVQLMPGPLFSFASYLGTFLAFTPYPLFNALLATIAIFLPSFFLIFGCLPYWSRLMNNDKLLQTIAGLNAAVVGLLLCLTVQMSEKYVSHFFDIIFICVVIFLLKSKLPIWLSLIGSFIVYLFMLNHAF